LRSPPQGRSSRCPFGRIFEAGASPLHAVDRYVYPFRASRSGLRPPVGTPDPADSFFASPPRAGNSAGANASTSSGSSLPRGAISTAVPDPMSKDRKGFGPASRRAPLGRGRHCRGWPLAVLPAEINPLLWARSSQPTRPFRLPRLRESSGPRSQHCSLPLVSSSGRRAPNGGLRDGKRITRPRTLTAQPTYAPKHKKLALSDDLGHLAGRRWEGLHQEGPLPPIAHPHIGDFRDRRRGSVDRAILDSLISFVKPQELLPSHGADRP
jgi:hypothetical protein